jgi:hypothetical protein
MMSLGSSKLPGTSEFKAYKDEKADPPMPQGTIQIFRVLVTRTL